VFSPWRGCCLLTCSMSACGVCTKYETFPLGEDCKQSWPSVATGLYMKTMAFDSLPSYSTCFWEQQRQRKREREREMVWVLGLGIAFNKSCRVLKFFSLFLEPANYFRSCLQFTFVFGIWCYCYCCCFKLSTQNTHMYIYIYIFICVCIFCIYLTAKPIYIDLIKSCFYKYIQQTEYSWHTHIHTHKFVIYT